MAAKWVRLTGDQRRCISTSIRFPAEEYLRIKKAAAKAHLSVSDYMRRCIPEASVNYLLKKQL